MSTCSSSSECSYLIREGTRGVATTDILSAGVLGELEHRALAELTGRHDDDI
jgi:hypothetical protein